MAAGAWQPHWAPFYVQQWLLGHPGPMVTTGTWTFMTAFMRGSVLKEMARAHWPQASKMGGVSSLGQESRIATRTCL